MNLNDIQSTRGEMVNLAPFSFPPTTRLEGIPVRLVEHLEEMVRTQVRFPRSKKKRIQKKWRTQAKNYDAYYPPKVYSIHGLAILCNKAGTRTPQTKNQRAEWQTQVNL